jgi:catechol 2,3-dioxygenase-like lactoylglutathione lyase family enzyme
VQASSIQLDHIAFGVPDGAAVVPFVVGALGGAPRGAGPGGGFRWWQWEYAGGGALEILEPDGPPGGFLHRFLEARGAGPHHVTFKVPDIHAAIERARAHGHEVVGFDDTWPSWIEAFLHPKRAQGIVVQLVESHPELDSGDFDPDAWPFPETPPDPPPPVTFAGLHLRARSAERARRQWCELLQAECTECHGRLLFRWPGSPLRIAVSIDPSRDEGPLAAEILSSRALALPEGPHPLLGLPFEQVKE